MHVRLHGVRRLFLYRDFDRHITGLLEVQRHGEALAVNQQAAVLETQQHHVIGHRCESDLATGEVTFAPMAYHVMLLGLKDRSLLTDGKRFPMTLHFEKSGDVTLEVAVQKQAPDTMQAHVHKP